MVAVFLLNLLCAIVSCDPYYPPPTPRPYPENGGNTLLSDFRTRRNLDLEPDQGNLTNFNFKHPPPLVETQSGTVEGYFMKVMSGREIYAFEGIPFAEAPTGNLRFRAPVPKRRWNGIRQAKNPGPLCTQMHIIKRFRVVGREDCLTLSVYSPMIPIQDYNPNLSVVIWIYGGGFIFGGGAEYGPAYLLQKDIILVTLNYRVGVLGFLSSGDDEAPGNWGMKDQALAIKWVANNIGAFGGNNRSITLAGQSAGAVSVHLHMMSNMSKHLFQRAIGMSGSAFVGWAVHTPHQARKWAEKLAKFVGCPINKGSKAMMNCFRSRDPNSLAANQYNLYDVIAFPPIHFRPVIEPDLPGAFLTISPKEAYEQNQVARIPFIASNTNAETDLGAIVLTGIGFLKLWLRHWNTLAPSMLDYRLIAKNATDVTRAINNFYFPGRNTATISGTEFTQIGSDRYCYTGNRKAISFHSRIAPTYSYMMSHRNEYGFASLFGMNPNEYGVSHAEDLPFVFNSTAYWGSWNGTEKGFAISELLVSLFANFIMNGEPVGRNQPSGVTRHIIWDPVTSGHNPSFLQIGEEDIKMVPDPRKREMEFWDGLGLNDSYAYEYA